MTSALAAQIATAFGLPEPTDSRVLAEGWTSNLRLDVPGVGALVARIYGDPTSFERLAAIQAARTAVADAGIPAVRPMTAPDGSEIVRLPDGRLAELEPFIEWDAQMNTVPLLEKGFALCARMHDVLRSASIPAAGRTAVRANHIDSEVAAAATHRGAKRMRDWNDLAMSRFADRVASHIDAVDALEAPLRNRQVRQIVHGDFWDNNVLFRNGEPAVLLDFDFMAERPRIDDLALTAYFYLLEPGKALPAAEDRAQLRRFLDAYDAATTLPLSPEERAAFPLAIARQPAWSVGRWIVELDDAGAREHAAYAIGELPVAQAIIAELPQWNDAFRL